MTTIDDKIAAFQKHINKEIAVGELYHVEFANVFHNPKLDFTPFLCMNKVTDINFVGSGQYFDLSTSGQYDKRHVSCYGDIIRQAAIVISVSEHKLWQNSKIMFFTKTFSMNDFEIYDITAITKVS